MPLLCGRSVTTEMSAPSLGRGVRRLAGKEVTGSEGAERSLDLGYSSRWISCWCFSSCRGGAYCRGRSGRVWKGFQSRFVSFVS